LHYFVCGQAIAKIQTMLARLLQIVILCMVTSSAAVFWILWRHSPQLALAGLLLVPLLHAPFLGFQFLAARRYNRNDPAPQATVAQSTQAWWGELVQLPLMFFWHLPFVWNQVPDNHDNAFAHRGKRGVVFIHGFICNRGIWTPWLNYLKKHKRAFVALNLEPLFGSIEDYAALIESAVQKVTQDTGMPPLVVCHSMGGLAVRAWLRSAKADQRVHHIVTIGSPHHGTWMARFSPMTNGRQMHLSNDWLRQLEADEPAERHKLFTCYYSNCDNIVFPASTATLSGADNRLIPGTAHVALVLDQTIMSESFARI
jgi:triacylglycerol esterase/lipase EstA (alpha/beta hydrolase family)